MNVSLVAIARSLLGLVFVASGASGFFLIGHPPAPPPGLAGAFQDVFFRSHWVLFVDAIELIAGILLLSSRYVPLALVALAAIIANIVIFHLTMAPSGLPVAAILIALWIVVAREYRANFAPLLLPQHASHVPESSVLVAPSHH